jgi:hypothetical protein
VAVLALVAVLAAASPRRRGAVLAVATALKLWPVALLPAAVVRHSQRRPVAVGYVLTGVLVVAGCLLLAGVHRLVSPLHWQLDRGLQVESVPATPLLLARVFAPGHWSIAFSRWTTYELFGPGVGAVLGFTSGLLIGVLFGVVGLCVRSGATTDAAAFGRLTLATTALLVVTGKVLSPQYVLWLIGPLCGLLVLAPDDPGLRRAARLLAVVAGMTQFVYPVAYRSLRASGPVAELPGTLWLAGRNVLVVWFAVVAVRQVRAPGWVGPRS